MSKHTDPKTAPAAPIYRTARKNDLGDELVVIDARSDWGERGWMICVEERPAGRKPSLSARVFYPWDKREVAVDCANTGSFYGFAKPVAGASTPIDFTAAMIP